MESTALLALDTLLDRILAAPARLGGTRLVCVDGPAGSGKTTFGRRLAAAPDAPVVQLGDPSRRGAPARRRGGAPGARRAAPPAGRSAGGLPPLRLVHRHVRHRTDDGP